MIKIMFVLGHEPTSIPNRPLYYGVSRNVEWPAVPRSGELLVLLVGPNEVVTARVLTLRWQIDGSVHVLFDAKLTIGQADWMVENGDWQWTAYSPTDAWPQQLPRISK